MRGSDDVLRNNNNNEDDDGFIQVSVVTLEYTMCPVHPTLDYARSAFFNRDVKYVPVIHIYGSTPAGQVCDIVLPYFLVPFPSHFLSRDDSFKMSFVQNLGKEIERKMEDRRRSMYKTTNSDRPWHYIHDIVLVRGTPFYGYWKKDELFMKIFVYNPNHVAPIAAILQSGVVVRHQFQPYEVHIPYLLQFMIDFNVVGMGLVNMRSVMFRLPVPLVFQKKELNNHIHIEYNEMQERLYLKSTVNLDLCLPGKVERMSYSDIEMDGICEDILNYNQIDKTEIKHDNLNLNLVQTLTTIWEEEKQRRQQMGLSSAIPKASQSQPRSSSSTTEIQNAMFSRLKQIIEEESCPEPGLTNDLSKYPVSYLPYFSIKTQVETVGTDTRNISNMNPVENTNKIRDEDEDVSDILDWMKDQDFTDDIEEIQQIDEEWEINDDGEPIDHHLLDNEEEKISQQERRDILESYREETQLEEQESLEQQKQALLYFSQNQIPQSDGHDEQAETTGNILQESSPRKRKLASASESQSKRPRQTFAAGDFVYLRPPGYKHGENYYIGYIQEINEKSAKIRWLFRREELPIGVMEWQSEKELFLSDLVDSQLIATIISTVKVMTIYEAFPSQSQELVQLKCLPATNFDDGTFICRFEYRTNTGEFKPLSDELLQLFQQIPLKNISPILPLSDSSSSTRSNYSNTSKNAGMNLLNESSVLMSSQSSYSESDNEIWDVELDETLNPPVQQQDLSYLGNTIVLEYSLSPPLARNLPETVSHQQAFYSKPTDYNTGKKASDLRFRGLGLTTTHQKFPRDMSATTLKFYSATSCSVHHKRRVHTETALESDLILEYSIPPPTLSRLKPVVGKENQGGAGEMRLEIDGHGRLLIPNRDVGNTQDFLSRPPSPKWSEAMGYTSQVSLFASSSVSEAVNFSTLPTTINNITNNEETSPNRSVVSAASALNAKFESPIKKGRSQLISQISIPTCKLNAKKALQFDKPEPPKAKKRNNMCTISIEIHVTTRVDLRPNPIQDPIEALFFCIQNDEQKKEFMNGLLIVEDENHKRCYTNEDLHIRKYPTEKTLLIAFIDLIQYFDPDIILGYEIQTDSLGYLVERSSVVLGYNICKKISRVVHRTVNNENSHRRDEWGRTHQSGIHVRGRVIMNVWRIMRHEVKLYIYTFENVVFNVLGIRFPHLSYQTRTKWFKHEEHEDVSHQHFSVVMQYYSRRAKLNLELLYHLDVINRTCQLAKVFGIEFFNVISRGSQYRVESMMIRLAKPRNYVILSPSKQQVTEQNAIECIPLVMEPSSKMYSNPVIVLDFQSLYPSIVIAYNLCFSTCLGKISKAVGARRVGVLPDYRIPDEYLGQFADQITITPNGVMFIKETTRAGVLPRMLREILDSRVMIKKSMSDLKSNKTMSNEEKEMVYRTLNARQFGLKMIANVTYGYTSANYSGRMPMSDLADAIVQIGRSTLELAIQTVNKDFAQHNARVVYGDTDSLFVEVVGATREQAFKVGRMIADVVSAQNPSPMKLQMEKVFHPCVLVTKKRYVGFAYSDEKQAEPVFDAKGIETIRRDTCKVVATMLEKSLRIVFNSKDLSKVKEYCERQWAKILRGKVSVKDFIFAKEVRLGTYSERGTLPPAAIIAQEAMKRDPRAEPLYGERIPYVVVYGDPNARLIDMVVSPHKFIMNQGVTMRLHTTYYITRQIIPALDRLFSLMGVDVKSWYEEMSKKSRGGWRQFYHCSKVDTRRRKPALRNKTINAFYGTRFCIVCETGLINYQKKSKEVESVTNYICRSCQKNSQQTSLWLNDRYRDVSKHMQIIQQICMNCMFGCHMDRTLAETCDSLDCGVMFTRKRTQNHLNSIQFIADQYSQPQDPIVDHEDWF